MDFWRGTGSAPPERPACVALWRRIARTVRRFRRGRRQSGTSVHPEVRSTTVWRGLVAKRSEWVSRIDGRRARRQTLFTVGHEARVGGDHPLSFCESVRVALKEVRPRHGHRGRARRVNAPRRRGSEDAVLDRRPGPSHRFGRDRGHLPPPDQRPSRHHWSFLGPRRRRGRAEAARPWPSALRLSSRI